MSHAADTPPPDAELQEVELEVGQEDPATTQQPPACTGVATTAILQPPPYAPAKPSRVLPVMFTAANVPLTLGRNTLTKSLMVMERLY